jgi:hypothetical protein
LRVYLIYDAGDQSSVKPIEAYLRAEGCIVEVPLLEGTTSEVRQDHQDTLQLCDAVLIFYGTGRPAWLREKQRDLRKAPGWGRTRPFLAQAVYVGDPASDEKSGYTHDEFIIVRGDDGSAGETLGAFLAKARTAPSDR